MSKRGMSWDGTVRRGVQELNVMNSKNVPPLARIMRKGDNQG